MLGPDFAASGAACFSAVVVIAPDLEQEDAESEVEQTVPVVDVHAQRAYAGARVGAIRAPGEAVPGPDHLIADGLTRSLTRFDAGWMESNGLRGPRWDGYSVRIR